ncbi:hypothetical protein B0H13DRAFT_1853422 [Mycena leptocephala]|nr:hypothetical protein B0H13DRAFT_1853422 [Mycena leptocephala]
MQCFCSSPSLTQGHIQTMFDASTNHYLTSPCTKDNYETSMGLPSNLFRRQLQLTVSFVDSKQLRGLLEFDSGLGLVLWYVLEENARQMKKAELPKNSQCKTKDKYQEDVLSTASPQFHGEWIMLAQVVPSGDAVLPHHPWGARNTRKPVSYFGWAKQANGLASRYAGLGLGTTPKSKPKPEKACLRGCKPVLQAENVTLNRGAFK